MLGSSLISYKQVTRRKTLYKKGMDGNHPQEIPRQIKARKHMSWKNITIKDNPNKNKIINKKNHCLPQIN
jgi:hypothetical protein